MFDTNTLNDNILFCDSHLGLLQIAVKIEIYFRIIHFGYIISQSRGKKQLCPRL